MKIKKLNKPNKELLDVDITFTNESNPQIVYEDISNNLLIS